MATLELHDKEPLPNSLFNHLEEYMKISSLISKDSSIYFL